MSASAPTLSFDIDRRRFARHPCNLKVFCKAFADRCSSESWPAEVRDLSQSGLRFLLHRRFEIGTLLVVELRNLDTDASATLPARVMRVWSQQALWVLGCEFTTRLGVDEVYALVQDTETVTTLRRAA